MTPRAVLMVGGGALLKNAAAGLRKIGAQIVLRLEQPQGRIAEKPRLVFLHNAAQLQQATGGHRARDVVDAVLVRGLAKIAVGQAVLADVGNKVAGRFPAASR